MRELKKACLRREIVQSKNENKVNIANLKKRDKRGRNCMEFEKLQKVIAEVLNVETDDITMNTTFVDDLGADSLDIFQIIMGIEEEFDIEIPTEAAEKIVTVGDAIEQIKNATN